MLALCDVSYFEQVGILRFQCLMSATAFSYASVMLF